MGQSFGYFSPRFLSELAQHSDSLSAVSDQLDDYETAWTRTLHSLNRVNLARFMESDSGWAQRLNEEELKGLSGKERAEVAGQLLIDLVDFIEKDPETAERLRLLREKAEATRQASYRAEVREAVVLRMRFVLIGIAGRQFLSDLGSDSQRLTYSNLVEAEAFTLPGKARSESPRVVVEPFPRFDEEIALANAALPGWMGIQFRQVPPERREQLELEDGAVSVLAVYPDSPARKSGLEVGDIIVGPAHKPFKEQDFVREWVMTAPIGEAQSLQVRRGEERLMLALTPEPYPREWPSLPGPPKVGSQAPALSQIEGFRGNPPEKLFEQRPYLLFFWATWCGPCKAAVPELLAFERERNVPVISITDETAESVEAFLQQRNDPFPEAIALDEYRRSFLAYGVSGTPSFVLVDAQGKIESISSGYRRSEGLRIENWAWGERAGTAGSTSQ
jgi:thiol-disulfide isomerase/thioredoxin